MSIFNASDHARLATLFDSRSEIDRHGDLCATSDNYPGYKPEVREAPNGDTKVCDACDGFGDGQSWPGLPVYRCQTCKGTGRVPNVDAGPAGKRYLHVAPKYDPPEWAMAYLARAHYEACRVAEALGVPAAYYPRVADGTLRVLEYPSAGHDMQVHGYKGPWYCTRCGEGAQVEPGVCPALAPGAGTAEHTDFDLFTIVLWRSTPEDLELLGDHDHENQRIQPRANERGALDQQGREHGDRVSRGAADAAFIADATPPASGRRPERGNDMAPEVERSTGGASAYAGTDGRSSPWRAAIDRAGLISHGLHIGELGELVGLGPATPHRVPARPYAQKSIVYFAMPDHTAVLPQYYERGMSKGGQTVGEWLAERVARSRY